MKAIIYGRVSTDEQRKESIDAQLAQCRELCAREKFNVVGELSDFGISGADPNRPGYQSVLRSVRAHKADVIVAHELSRLWRNEAEMHAVMDELAYLKKHVVCLVGGIDTRIADLKILISVLGAVAAHESKQTAIRSHSRMKEYVAKGESSGGGRCYGYAVDPESKTAKRVIDPKQAAVVVEIFTRYAAGESPRAIAAELNRRGVSSPGAAWSRTTRRRDGRWLASTIYGDPKRASGILNNELYIGRYVWNRSRRLKHFKTKRTEFERRPISDRIVVEHPALRVVAQPLWDRVRARQRELSARIGAKVRAGLSIKAVAGREGGIGNRRYLFSGLLKCGECGASFIVSGPSQSYACGSYVNGGKHACDNHLRVPKARVEERLLTDFRKRLLSDEALDLFKREVRDLLRASRKESTDSRAARARRAAKLRTEIDNLTDAIASGALRTNRAIADRLNAATDALEKVEAELAVGSVNVKMIADTLPRVADRYRRLVENLPGSLTKDVTAAREAIGGLIGGAIRLSPDATGKALVGEYGLSREALMFACLGRTGRQANVSNGSGGSLPTCGRTARTRLA